MASSTEESSCGDEDDFEFDEEIYFEAATVDDEKSPSLIPAPTDDDDPSGSGVGCVLWSKDGGGFVKNGGGYVRGDGGCAKDGGGGHANDVGCCLNDGGGFVRDGRYGNGLCTNDGDDSAAQEKRVGDGSAAKSDGIAVCATVSGDRAVGEKHCDCGVKNNESGAANASNRNSSGISDSVVSNGVENVEKRATDTRAERFSSIANDNGSEQSQSLLHPPDGGGRYAKIDSRSRLVKSCSFPVENEDSGGGGCSNTNDRGKDTSCSNRNESAKDSHPVSRSPSPAASYEHSQSSTQLFADGDDRPSLFNICTIDPALRKSLTRDIQSEGGVVVSAPFAESSSVVCLVHPDQAATWQRPGVDLYSTEYVKDCLDGNRTLDMRPYLVGVSHFDACDPREILFGKKKWSDLRRKELTGDSATVPTGAIAKAESSKIGVTLATMGSRLKADRKSKQGDSAAVPSGANAKAESSSTNSKMGVTHAAMGSRSKANRKSKQGEAAAVPAGASTKVCFVRPATSSKKGSKTDDEKSKQSETVFGISDVAKSVNASRSSSRHKETDVPLKPSDAEKTVPTFTAVTPVKVYGPASSRENCDKLYSSPKSQSPPHLNEKVTNNPTTPVNPLRAGKTFKKTMHTPRILSPSQINERVSNGFRTPVRNLPSTDPVQKYDAETLNTDEIVSRTANISTPTRFAVSENSVMASRNGGATGSDDDDDVLVRRPRSCQMKLSKAPNSTTQTKTNSSSTCTRARNVSPSNHSNDGTVAGSETDVIGVDDDDWLQSTHPPPPSKVPKSSARRVENNNSNSKSSATLIREKNSSASSSTLTQVRNSNANSSASIQVRNNNANLSAPILANNSNANLSAPIQARNCSATTSKSEKSNDFDDNDDDDWSVSSEKRRRGCPFSREEQKCLLRLLLDHRGCQPMGGNELWKPIECRWRSKQSQASSYLEPRTWSSLRENFLKKIFPSIDKFGLSAEEVADICSWKKHGFRAKPVKRQTSADEMSSPAKERWKSFKRETPDKNKSAEAGGNRNNTSGSGGDDFIGGAVAN